MAGAHRNKKISTYKVRVVREVTYETTMVIDARSVEEAEGIATANASDMHDGDSGWHRSFAAGSVKAKLVRAT